MERTSASKVSNIFSYATASFAMTFTRLIVALGAGFAVLNNTAYAKETTVLSILFIMIFDYYDGNLFEKSFLREQKVWRLRRRIADSVVDRLVIQIICIPLLVSNRAFLWFYVAIAAREIAISGYNAIERLRHRFIIYPGPVSKLACTAVGLVTIAFLTNQSIFLTLTLVLMLVLAPFSLREYQQKVARFRTLEREGELKEGVIEVP